MFNFTRLQPLHITDIKEVWTKIPSKYTSILAISLTGNEILSAEDQFNTFYNDRTLIGTNKTTVINLMIMIFMDNLLLIEQIGQMQELIKKLGDLDNWAHVTKYISDVDNSGTVITDIDNLNQTFNLSSDNNSEMNQDKIKEYIKIKGDVNPIPANTLNQTGSQDIANNQVTNKETGKTSSTTSASNSAEDFKAFLRLEIPRLRERFWSKFNNLFRY